jgi:hypothetical protein
VQTRGVVAWLLGTSVLLAACGPAAPEAAEPVRLSDSPPIVVTAPPAESDAFAQALPVPTGMSTTAPARPTESLPGETTSPVLPQPAPTCVTPERAAELLGQTGCVEGRVTRLTHARNSRGSPTFLDLGDRFTAVIWIEDQPTFPGVDSWRDRRLRIRGPVETFRGKPQVILRRAEQVELLPPLPRP